MQAALASIQTEAAVLFAATVLLVVVFLIARVANARQSVALAVALTPTILVAVAGLVA